MASIVKRKKKYSVVYTVEIGGEKKQRWETCNTHAEAKKRKAEIELEQANGTFVAPSATTVAEFLKQYVEVYGRANWAYSTYSSTNSLFDNYVIPYIGDTLLRQCTTSFFNNYFVKLKDVPQPSVIYCGATLAGTPLSWLKSSYDAKRERGARNKQSKCGSEMEVN